MYINILNNRLKLLKKIHFSDFELNMHAFNTQMLSFSSERLHILENENVYHFELSKWDSIIESYEKAGKYGELFKICKEIYAGDIPIIGLPQKKAPRDKILADFVTEYLIERFADASFLKYGGSPPDVHLDYLRNIADFVLEISISMERSTSYLPKLYQKYYYHNLQHLFFASVEIAVIDERLSFLPYLVIDKMVLFYIEKSYIDRLGMILMHLIPDHSTRDLLINICEEYGFMESIIHFYVIAYSDFIKPVEYLIQKFDSLNNLETIKHNSYILFVFISYCITGHKFPAGLLNKEDAKNAKAKTLMLVFAPSQLTLSNLFNTRILEGKVKEPWPFLRYIIGLDTCEFLKFLANVFENLENFRVEDNIYLECQSATQYICGMQSATELRQLLLHILILIRDDTDFDINQRCGINAFIARTLERYRRLNLSEDVIYTIFEELIQNDNMNSKEEREFACLCLLETGFTPIKNQFDQTKYLVLYKNAKLWRILEKESLKLKRFDEVISSYIHDPLRINGIFFAIRKIIEMNDEIATFEIRKLIMGSLEKLVEVNVDLTCSLYSKYWPSDLTHVLKALDSSPFLKFKYLRSFHENNSSENFSLKMYYSYLELLCQFEPEYLKSILVRFESVLEIDLDILEKLSKKYKIEEAFVWIAEKKSDFQAALNIALRILTEMPITYSLDDCHKWMDIALDCCQKAQSYLIEKDAKNLWIQLLCKLCFFEKFSTVEYVRTKILDSIMQYLPLRVIMEKIIEIKGLQSFGKYKKEIIGILEQCSEKRNSLEISLAIASRRAESDQISRHLLSISAFTTTERICVLCKRILDMKEMFKEEKSENIIIFHCKHAFHQSCLLEGLSLFLSYPVNSKQPGEYFCVVCWQEPNLIRKMQKGKKGITEFTLLVIFIFKY